MVNEATGKAEPLTSVEGKPSQRVLAESWLSSRASELQRKVGLERASLGFLETYEQKSPLRPPYVEQGSTDWADYEVAQLDYEQSPTEKEDEIGERRGKIDDLIDEISLVEAQRKEVGEGNLPLIEQLAGFEIERRRKIEEERKAREERERGIELNGIEEFSGQVRELLDLARAKGTPPSFNFKTGPGGWKFFYDPDLDIPSGRHGRGEQIQASFGGKEGPKGLPLVNLQIHGIEEGEEFRVSLIDYRNKVLESGRGDDVIAKLASVDFDIAGGRIFKPEISDVRVSERFGAEDGGRTGEKLTQKLFDQIRSSMPNVIKDLKGLTS